MIGGGYWPQLRNSWDLRPLKRVARLNAVTLPDETAAEMVIRYIDIGNIQEGRISAHETLSFAEAPSRARRIVYPGDVIVSTVRTYLKAVALIEGDTNNLIVSTGFAVLSPRRNILGRFLWYVAQSEPFVASVMAHSEGVSYPAIPPERLGTLKVPIVCEVQQEQIANFLDRETAKIDALIASYKKLIDLQCESAGRLITDAVCGRVNPSPKMRPSGIAWIGAIPDSWVLTRLKRVCTSIKDGTHNPPERAPGIHRLLSVRNMIDGDFVLLDDDRTMTPEAFNQLQKGYTVCAGDVLVAIVGATTGKSAIMPPLEDVTVQRSVAVLRPDIRLVTSKFLHYWVQSDCIQQPISSSFDEYSAQPGIYLRDLGELPVVVPPLPGPVPNVVEIARVA